jgi:hypothetical protein
MTQFDANWVNWAIENIARGVSDKVVTDKMVDAGLKPDSVELLVNKVRTFPGYDVLKRTLQKCEKLEAKIAKPITGSLTTHANVLPVELIKEITEYVALQKTSRTNLTCWAKELVRSSNAVLVFDLSKDISTKILDYVKVFAPELNDFSFSGCAYQRWMPGSYISWHSDYSWKYAVTIYLNEKWDKNWGGYFAYEVDDGIKCIKPEFNTASKIKLPLEHLVFSVAPDAPPRNSIQIFAS